MRVCISVPYMQAQALSHISPLFPFWLLRASLNTSHHSILFNVGKGVGFFTHHFNSEYQKNASSSHNSCQGQPVITIISASGLCSVLTQFWQSRSLNFALETLAWVKVQENELIQYKLYAKRIQENCSSLRHISLQLYLKLCTCQTFVIAYTEVSATVSLYHLPLSYEDPESPETCHVEQIKFG